MHCVCDMQASAKGVTVANIRDERSKQYYEARRG